MDVENFIILSEKPSSRIFRGPPFLPYPKNIIGPQVTIVDLLYMNIEINKFLNLGSSRG